MTMPGIARRLARLAALCLCLAAVAACTTQSPPPNLSNDPITVDGVKQSSLFDNGDELRTTLDNLHYGFVRRPEGLGDLNGISNTIPLAGYDFAVGDLIRMGALTGDSVALTDIEIIQDDTGSTVRIGSINPQTAAVVEAVGPLFADLVASQVDIANSEAVKGWVQAKLAEGERIEAVTSALTAAGFDIAKLFAGVPPID